MNSTTQVAWVTGPADALSGCMINVDDDLPALVARREEIQRAQMRVLRMKL